MDEKENTMDAHDKLLTMVANFTVIATILIGSIFPPIYMFFLLGDIDSYYFFTVIVSYLMVLCILLVIILPFKKVLLNYRVGFYRTSYRNLELSEGLSTVERVLKDMGKKYTITEKFVMSRIYNDVGTLFELSDPDLLIIIRKIKVNSKLFLFSVRIGKIKDENWVFAQEIKKQLDTKLKG